MARVASTIEDARLLKERALAKLRVLQSDALEGKLLDRDQVRAQWAQCFASLRDRALGMADRIASRGANRTPAELRSIVDLEVKDLLEAVSRGDF